MTYVRIKKSICIILTAILFVLCNSAVTFASTTENTNYNLESCGVSIDIPSEWYAVWQEMPEDDENMATFGFNSNDDVISYMEELHTYLETYTTVDSNESGYSVMVGNGTHLNTQNISDFKTATDDQKSNFLNNIKSEINQNYGTSIDGDIKSEMCNVNDTDYFHCTFNSSGNGRNIAGDNYYTIIGNEVIFIDGLAMYTQEENNTTTLAEYTKSAIETVKIDESVLGKGSTSNQENDDNLQYGVIGDGSSSTDNQSAKTSLLTRFNSLEFPMVIFIIILAGILIFGIKFSKPKQWQEDALSLDSSKCIQGFCALLIIFHHLSQSLVTTDSAGILSIFTETGVMFVGIFFFFSGYGLFKSLITKENYFKGFFKKRFSAILVPFLSCVFVFMIFSAILGVKYDFKSFILTLIGWRFINPHMWFIVEIALFYVAFFFIYKFIKKKSVATIVITLFVAGVTIGSLYLNHGDYWFQGEWWYNTSLVFVLGIIIAQCEKEIIAFAKKFYWVLLPLSTLATVGLYIGTTYALENYSYWAEFAGIPGYKEKFICLAFQLPMVIFFVITLVLIMMKVRFSNPILKFLGKISLELYLIHNLFLTNLRSDDFVNISSNSMYVLMTVLCSIGLAFIVNGFDKYVIGMIAGKKQLTVNNDKQIHSINFMRIIAVFLVVCIHIPLAGQAGNVVIAYGKIAVPFFLVVCGYFLYRDDNSEFFKRLLKQGKRIFILTVIANLLYLVTFFVAHLVNNSSVASFFTKYFTSKSVTDFLLFNMSPFGDHLWYLGSLLYAILLLMLLCKTKLHKYAMFISPVLLGVYIYLSWNGNAEYFVYRNALFVSLPYVMMGCLIKRYQEKLMKINLAVLVGIFAILCATNIFELNKYGTTGVPFFSAELLVYVLVLILLKLPNLGKDTFAEKLGDKCSLFIYIVHMLPILAIGTVINQNVGLIKNFGAFTIFAITTVFAIIYAKIKQIILLKKSSK